MDLWLFESFCRTIPVLSEPNLVLQGKLLTFAKSCHIAICFVHMWYSLNKPDLCLLGNISFEDFNKLNNFFTL